VVEGGGEVGRSGVDEGCWEVIAGWWDAVEEETGGEADGTDEEPREEGSWSAAR
jgi:hypothetical protein